MLRGLHAAAVLGNPCVCGLRPEDMFIAIQQVRHMSHAHADHVARHCRVLLPQKFEAEGFAALQPQYLSAWMHSNQQVELAEGAATSSSPANSTGQGAAPQRVRLTITGLTEHGFLLAVDAYGGRHELTPDGNSLDMMQGLIRRKLPG